MRDMLLVLQFVIMAAGVAGCSIIMFEVLQ